MTTDRRQWIDMKFVVQTAVTIALSVGGAALGSYMGTQTKTAVLENAVSGMTREMEGLRGQITGQTNEFRASLSALSTLVNNTNLKAASDGAKFQSDVEAMRREIENEQRARGQLSEYYELQASRLDAMRDRLSRLEGELKLQPKKE